MVKVPSDEIVGQRLSCHRPSDQRVVSPLDGRQAQFIHARQHGRHQPALGVHGQGDVDLRQQVDAIGFQTGVELWMLPQRASDQGGE